MRCISCESENVTVIDGNKCRCDDCGVGWKEPAYKANLNKSVEPSCCSLETLKDNTGLPWALVIILLMVCVYLYLGV